MFFPARRGSRASMVAFHGLRMVRGNRESIARDHGIDGPVAPLTQAMATYAGNNPGVDPTVAKRPPGDPTLHAAIAAAWHH